MSVYIIYVCVLKHMMVCDSARIQTCVYIHCVNVYTCVCVCSEAYDCVCLALLCVCIELNLDYIVDNPWVVIPCSALHNTNMDQVGLLSIQSRVCGGRMKTRVAYKYCAIVYKEKCMFICWS